MPLMIYWKIKMRDFETPAQFENLWVQETETLVKTIISQHDTMETNNRDFYELHNENLKLSQKIFELEQQIEDLEDELDAVKANKAE
jgi:cell division protein FtsB